MVNQVAYKVCRFKCDIFFNRTNANCYSVGCNYVYYINYIRTDKFSTKNYGTSVRGLYNGYYTPVAFEQFNYD